MTVLGTPCETVLLPVNTTSPFTTGLLPEGPERKAISQNKTAMGMMAGATIHFLNRLEVCRTGGRESVAAAGVSCNLNSCQSLYPSTDTRACRVDGCGVLS